MGSGNSVFQLSSDEISRLRNALDAVNAVPETASEEAGDDQVDRTAEDPNSWQCIRVFVSSTFADMFAEREYLVKIIFPRLREWCEARRMRLVEVDLRWGVPADSNSEIILRACLEEIEYCKEVNDNQPFFINMLGHRYGWIPSVGDVPETVKSQFDWIDGASVTTMELLCASLRMNNPNVLCLIRSDSILPYIPEEFIGDFMDSSWMSKCALDGLKLAIRNRYQATDHLVEYSVAVEGLTQYAGIPKVALSKLDFFGTAVYDHLITKISRQYPNRVPNRMAATGQRNNKNTSILQLRSELNDHHDAFCRNLNQVVLGRDEQIAHFLTWLSDVSADNVDTLSTPELDAKKRFYAVIGQQGVGKSTMVACADDAARIGHTVIFHSAQADDSTDEFVSDSCSIVSLIVRICVELGDDQVQTMILTAVAKIIDQLEILDLFIPVLRFMYSEKRFKEGISATTPALVFIDEAPLLAYRYVNVHLIMHLLYPWPFEVRYIFGIDASFNDFFAQILQISQAGGPTLDDHIINLEPLEESTIGKIIIKKFAAYNKRLSTEQLRKILSNPGCKHLGWLSMACEEIRLFGAFETLTDHIAELPPTIKGLVTTQLERLVFTLGMIDGQQEGPHILYCRIRDTLLLLICSFRGLSDSELRDLLAVDIVDTAISTHDTRSGRLAYAEWSVIYFWTKSFVRVIGDSFGKGQTRLVIRNETVKKVIQQFYKEVPNSNVDIATPSEARYRRELANYFFNCAEKYRYREEYPYQISELCDLPAISILIKSDDFSFLHYTMRRKLIDKLRCRDLVMFTNAAPELMCLPCSMKATFQPIRMNRNACCICGGFIFSRFENHGLNCKVIINMAERAAYKCRRHTKLPLRGPASAAVPRLEQCMVCSNMVNREICFSPVVCGQCNDRSSQMIRCCHMSTS